MDLRIDDEFQSVANLKERIESKRIHLANVERYAASGEHSHYEIEKAKLHRQAAEIAAKLQHLEEIHDGAPQGIAKLTAEIEILRGKLVHAENKAKIEKLRALRAELEAAGVSL